MNQDITSLICLFHHRDHAQAALQDLLNEGIPESNINLIGPGSNISANQSSLAELNVPERDVDHLLKGLESGGALLAVSAISDHVDAVESIFRKHSAGKIDETVVEDDMSGAALPLTASASGAVPIVEEELQVGKRTVDAGGVRVYRKVVEIPVEESVNLRDEHVVVERHPVDRAVTDADLALQGNRTIELIETAEEVVVGKNARVVEEVLVGKEVGEHTETVRDTVRHTEVEIEEVPPAAGTVPGTRSY